MNNIIHVCRICRTNFLKWKNNNKIILIAILLVVLIRSTTKNLMAFSMQVQLPTAPWIFPFLFAGKYYKLLFYFPLLLLFCNVPNIDDTYYYMLIRSNRIKWCLGQLLYVFLSTLIYFVFIFTVSIFFCLPNLEWTNDWGTFLGTLANTTLKNSIPDISISPKLVNCFTPFQAISISLTLMCLSGFLLGLINFLCNISRLPKFVGVVSSTTVLLLDALFVSTGNIKYYYFSPLTWTNINLLDFDKRTNLPSFEYAIIMYLVLIACILIAIFLVTKNKALSLLYIK